MPRELNVTLRGGRVFAAYLYLQKQAKVARSKREPNGMVVDYSEDGIPLGVEFIAPSKVNLANVNTLLQSLGQEPASNDELWPLITRAGATAA